MPYRTILSACLIAAYFAALPAVGQVAYIRRSSGLNRPVMEGGNTDLALGDVNGDGHVDIVSIGDHGSPFVNTQEHGVMVWFGDGTGVWSVFQTGNFGYGGCALGDVNNDGLMDIGYGMHHDYSSNDFGDQILEVALGDGTGKSWRPWDDGLATNGESWGMFGAAFADVDNDGDLDVGSISFGCCAGVHVYLNNGDGTWTQSFGFTGGNSNAIFRFADFNGDGFADFAVGHGRGRGSTYLGDGKGGFTPADGNLPTPGIIGRLGISVGDVNGDGRDDLGFVTDNGGLAIWTMVAPKEWKNLSGSLPASGKYRLTQIADMDLDGNGDLVAFRPGDSDQVVVYGGDGAGTWRLFASIDAPASCDYSAFRAGVDFDHNGYPDIAYVSEENCRPFVGGVNRPRVYVESSTPQEITVYPKTPRGGETLIAGSVRFVDWHAGVPNREPLRMTIELSQRGPDGPWRAIASDLPNSGRYQWLLPADLRTSDNNYLRFTLGGESFLTPGAFSIVGAEGFDRGDTNCDGSIDLADVEPFIVALLNPDEYENKYPDCDINNADINEDGSVDLTDVEPFIELLIGP